MELGSLTGLTYLEEGGSVLVGRPSLQVYAEFSPDGAALLRRLAAGERPTVAAEWYERTYGQPVDIDDFMTTLQNLGFLDDRVGQFDPESSLRGRHLGQKIFSRPAGCAYLVLVAVTATLLILEPDLRPSYQHVFFSPSITLVYLALLGGQVPISLLHEGYHALAARRIGVWTRTSLSRRFVFLVFETRMDGLVAVPRRLRYFPIIAGVVADLLAYCTLTVMAAVLHGGPDFWQAMSAFLVALATVTLARIGWQFLVFLRNDGYQLLATALGTSDLHGASMWTIRRWLARALGRAEQGATWQPRDLRHARWFAPLVAIGHALLLVVVVLGVVPALTHVWLLVSTALIDPAAGTARLLDLALFLVVSVIGPLIVFLFERRRRGASPKGTQ